jgi:ribulose-5-phosphate 4-epimerase/fuculose-1-phosphate aldolase
MLNYGIVPSPSWCDYSLISTAAYAIHAEIHSARPDVGCAAHSHSVYGRAFCATGRELDMLTQDSCVFYKDHVLYEYVINLTIELCR